MVQILIKPNNYRGYKTVDNWVNTLPASPPFLTHKTVSKKTRLLTFVSQILAKQRQIAWDHEHHRHQGKGEAWHGAALLRTVDQRWFLQSNIHLAQSNAARNCAENNVLTDGFAVPGHHNQIDELYFMGGRADKSNGIMMLPGEEGKRYTPCGSCRDVIHLRRRQDGIKSKITLLPLNEGNWIVLPHDGRNELAFNQALTTTAEDLLPELEINFQDHDGSIKSSLMKGWGYVRDGGNWRPYTQNTQLASMSELRGKSPQDTLAGINDFMMSKLCNFYHSSKRSVKFSDIVILRTSGGEFFTAASSINTKTAGTTPATDLTTGVMASIEIEAQVTDAFIMSFDFERFPDLVAKWRQNFRAHVTMPMPNGDARERIKKVGNAHNYAVNLFGESLGTQDASVHVFVPNGLSDFEPERHVVTRRIGALLPNSYLNPRALRMAEL